MASAPPISVVMPVRDGAPFLEEALDSIEAQSFGDFEFVVHDDGSTDATPEILAARAAQDPRYRITRSGAAGVAAASNRTCAEARGTWLVRMDADDVARPERLACLMALARDEPKARWLGSRSRFFPREAVGPGMVRYEAWLDQVMTHEEIVRARYVEYPLAHPSTAIRREAFEALGGYREGDFPEDYDLFLRAAAAGLRFAKHPEVLLDWREGPHRSIKRDPRYGLDRFRALKAAHLGPWLRARGAEVVVVGAGRDARRWSRALAAEEVAVARLADVDDDDLRPDPATFLLVADGRPGGRDEARAALTARGFHEEADYLCVQ